MEAYIADMQFWDAFVNVAFIVGMIGAALVFFFAPKNGKEDFFYLPMWAIIALGLLLRSPLLFHAPWYDETFSYAMTLPNWEDFPSVLMSDVHPPLHYLIVRIVSIVSSEMIILRLPSLIAGLSLIPLLYNLTLELSHSRGAAIFAAFFATTMPSLVYYSTEARYPIFLALAVAFGFYAMITERRGAFVLSCVFAVGFHATGLFYAVGLVAACIAYHGRKWLLICSAALVSSLWWLPLMLSQAEDVQNGFWLPLQSPVLHLVEMSFLRAGNSLLFVAVSSILGVFILGLGTYQAINKFNWSSLILIWAVPIGLWFVSAIWKPVYLPRALLGSIVILMPFSAWYIFQLRNKHLVMIAMSLIISLNLWGLWETDRGKREREVFQLCENADYVFVPETFLAIMARYYFEDNVIAWTESDNRHQTFETSSFEAIGIKRLDSIQSLNGSICIPYRLDYFTEEEEISFIESIEGETIAISEQHHLLRYFALIVREAED